jgi:hypothetical protein
MRRIYESGALHRDDEEPFAPGEREERPQAMRSVDGTAWSRRLLPRWVCLRALSVDVAAPDRVDGPAVPFVVTASNALPVPVTVETQSPRLWEWRVDGMARASHADTIPEEPEEPRAVGFDRGETKRFRRRWDRTFRVSGAEWEPAPAGEYTIGAGLNVADAGENGLYGETTVLIE